MDEKIKEGIEAAKRDKAYLDFFNTLSDLVNNTIFNYDGKETQAAIRALCRQHRQLQSDIITFVYKIMKEYGSHAGDECWEDPRNAWALSWAKRASELI